MRFEYILLLLVFILPIVYKLYYWSYIFEQQENKISHFLKHIKTKEWWQDFLYFWVFIEIPFFCLSILPIIDRNFEVLLFWMVFYFGILYSIFVIGKMLRANIVYPKSKKTSLISLFFIIFFINIWLLYDQVFIYILVMFIMLFTPLFFLLSLLLFPKNYK